MELKSRENNYNTVNLIKKSMYLSDRDIRIAQEAGQISISEFDIARLQPASYDIRLGNKFLIVKDHSVANIDPVNHILPEYEELVVTAEQ
jgi:deoxycytidine triphosphate deaminase